MQNAPYYHTSLLSRTRRNIMNTFPNTKQIVGSKACGPVCLLNIYTHLQIPLPLETILKELNMTEIDTAYLPQLARHCNARKLNTVILSSNPHTISPTWKQKTKKEIINSLKEWVTYNNDGWLKTCLFMLFYLQEGGNIKIVDLSTDIIDTYLDQGYTLLSCLEESWLWEKRKVEGKTEYDDIKGYTRGHFVVIYGKEGNNYLISDPYPTKIEGREGLYKVSKQKLLIATLVWNQEILAVKKHA